MKKLALVSLIILIASCAGNRTRYLIKSNAVNSSEACEILAANQKFQYKQAVKKLRKRNQGKSIPVASRDEIKPVAVTEAIEPVANTPEGPQCIETEETISLASVDAIAAATGDKIERKRKTKSAISRSNTYGSNTQPKQRETFLKTAYQTFRESTQALLLIGLAGLASLGLMKIGEKKSKRITHWSKKHPVLSRSAIVGAQSVATLGGLALGHDLYNSGVMIPEFSKWLPVGIFTAAASFYPNQFVSGNIAAFTYMRRKLHDVALFTSGAMMMTYAGNHYSLSANPQPAEQVVVSLSNLVHTESQFSLVKKDFASQPVKEETELNHGQAAAAISGTIIGFVLLTLLVAAASCSLSCSGNEGAAALLLIGGEGLLIWGLISILRKIKARLKPRAIVRPGPTT